MTSTQFQNPIVLAVDDDVDDTDLLRLLLRKAGVPNPVEIYREGEEIIEALTKVAQSSLKAIKPLLCILDVKMPGMTGHEVLRWIRSQRALDAMPVVMLSSSGHPDDIKQAAQNGAQCYLTKYPQPAVLREVIDEAERFAAGVPANECFRLPSNQLLVRWRRVNEEGGKAGR
jgi:CheY-like chemotaxis protein